MINYYHGINNNTLVK